MRRIMQCVHCVHVCVLTAKMQHKYVVVDENEKISHTLTQNAKRIIPSGSLFAKKRRTKVMRGSSHHHHHRRRQCDVCGRYGTFYLGNITKRNHHLLLFGRMSVFMSSLLFCSIRLLERLFNTTHSHTRTHVV